MRNVCNPVLLKLAKSRVERLKEDVEPLLTQETMKTRESARKGLGFGFVGGGFWDSGFGIWGWGLGRSRGSCPVFRVLGSGSRVSGSVFHPSGSRFRGFGFAFRVPFSRIRGLGFGVRGKWVVREGGDDEELRPWHYLYVYSTESRLIMRVRYDSI